MSKKLYPYLLISIIIFTAFFPALKAGFVNLDDDLHLYGNPAVSELSAKSVKMIFTQNINKTYVPLSVLTFAVEKHYFGLNPFVFHLDNLLLHMATVFLILLLAQRMGLSMRAALLAALIFAIHPMRVESVAWVTERKDVLYSFLYVLALHQYWSYLKTKSMGPYLMAVLLGFLSILAKSMALSLPLILLLFDWFDRREWKMAVFLEKTPFLLCAMGIGWITYSLNMRNPIESVHQGVLIWIWSFDFYIWKFLWPVHLCPYYLPPYPVSVVRWPYALSVGMFAGCIIMLAKFRRNRFVLFAFGYYFCSVFFLLRFSLKDFNIVADRFMYLPSLGFCFLCGIYLDQWIKSKWPAIAFFVILLCMEVKTNLQCYVWHDSLSLADEIIHNYPKSNVYHAYYSRGLFYYNQGNFDLAMADFNKSIFLNPDFRDVYCGRGIVWAIKGNYGKAIEDYDKAIALDNSYSTPYYNRSVVEEIQHNYSSALRDALYSRKLGEFVPEEYVKSLEIKNKLEGHG